MKAGHGCGRRLALIAFVAILTACGHDKPPTTVADACRMQSERPQWFAAMRKTEAKYGVPVSVQLATIARELSFVADARPTRRIGSGFFSREVPRSSAYGYAQALDGTWDDYRARHRAARRRPRRLLRLLGLHRLVHERRHAGERHAAARRLQPVSRLPRGQGRLRPRQLPRQGLAAAGGARRRGLGGALRHAAQDAAPCGG